MDNNKQYDKRLSPRITRTFIIRHRPRQDGELFEWDECFIKNMSLRGCYCSGSHPYKEGDILDIQIQLPTAKEPLRLTGEVKRCHPDKPLGVYGIAIQFLDLDEQQKNIINETIAFFLHKRSN